MFDQLASHLIEVVTLIVTMPVNTGEKFFVGYVATFFVLAYFSFRRYYRERSSDSFLRFLFPAAIYLSRSARVDYAVFLVNLLISPLILVGAGLQAWLSIQIATQLVAWNDNQAIYHGDWSTATYACFIVGYALVTDLSVYLLHRFHHQSDIFWPLHALHHSATVMTPVTLFRKHPIWNLLSHLLGLTFAGIFQGLFVFVYFGGPSVEFLFGLNTVYVLFNFAGANLRHSHVWLSWGTPLSYLFISPAMHQIHHDPVRMRKNYGEVFAIWDWMFGTLYILRSLEKFEIGLGEKDPHGTVTNAYVIPLRDSWRALCRKLGARLA